MPRLWGNRAPAAPQQLHYINQRIYHQSCDFLKFIPMEGTRKFSITPEISQVHAKRFLCLFSSALHSPPTFVKCFSTSRRWRRNTTKMIPDNSPGMDFPGGHHSTLALLCVETLACDTKVALWSHTPCSWQDTTFCTISEMFLVQNKLFT